MLAIRDLERLLPLVTDAFVELTGAQRGFLLLKNAESGTLKHEAGRTADRDDITEAQASVYAVARRVLKKDQAILVSNTHAQSSASAQRSFDEREVKMMACVPLRSDGEVVGVIYADSKNDVAGCGAQDINRIGEMLADQATAAINNARMFERAQNDSLTGLPNSSYFVLQVSKVMAQATNEQRAGLLLLDLDNFKRINDVAGAEMGDRALIDIASSIQEVLRTDGLVARYGSDKFAILLPSSSEVRVDIRLRDVAERARACVRAKVYHGIAMSASIGGIAFPGPAAQSAPDLIAMADDNLTAARKYGGGTIKIQ